MKNTLISWLEKQQPILETILHEAATEYYLSYRANRTFGYDAKITGKELWHLIRDKDLCYDRPTIGFNYSLWYHPKRVNTFLFYFTELIFESRHDESIE